MIQSFYIKTHIVTLILCCSVLLSKGYYLPALSYLAPKTSFIDQHIETEARKEIEAMVEWLQQINEPPPKITPAQEKKSQQQPNKYLPTRAYAKRLAAYYMARIASRSAYGTRIEPISSII